MAIEHTHYRMNQAEARRKYGSNANFDEKPLCGNGNFHASMNRRVRLVTCPACLEVLKAKPDYLEVE